MHTITLTAEQRTKLIEALALLPAAAEAAAVLTLGKPITDLRDTPRRGPALRLSQEAFGAMDTILTLLDISKAEIGPLGMAAHTHILEEYGP